MKWCFLSLPTTWCTHFTDVFGFSSCVGGEGSDIYFLFGSESLHGWGAKLFANSINNNENHSRRRIIIYFPFHLSTVKLCCWLVIAQWIIYYSIKLWKIVENAFSMFNEMTALDFCLLLARLYFLFPFFMFFFTSLYLENGYEFNCRLRCVARRIKWNNILRTNPHVDYILRVHSFTIPFSFSFIFFIILTETLCLFVIS